LGLAQVRHRLADPNAAGSDGYDFSARPVTRGFPATYLPRWLSPALARRDPLPPWQWVFFLAFVGVRGVVSLAAALAIPLTTAAGAPFPYRDLILFITFGVIVVTLVGQGLLLPSVVRRLGLGSHAADEREREHAAELSARAEALDVVQSRLEQLAEGGRVTPEVLAILRKITDEGRRRIERELDFEEASIACRKEGGVEPPL
jgi:CPA1 family monovalent cation:H+ antiporter